MTLSRSQIWCSLSLGAAFWLSAALTIRWTGPLGLFEGLGLGIAFALAIPATGAFLWIAKAVLRPSPQQWLPAIALMTAVAAGLDGLALALTPLYGNTSPVVVNGAAWILWGVALGLVFGVVTHLRAAPPAP